MPFRRKLPLLLAAALLSAAAVAFAPSHRSPRTARSPPSLITSLSASEEEPLPDFDDDESEENMINQENEEAKRLQEKAQALRDQIRAMESQIGDERRERYDAQKQNDDAIITEEEVEALGKNLKNKRVLIVGANGRVGSMVARYLLRTYGADMKEVVAAVHYVGEATTRGYGRLSYEVGAEDGVGTIGAAWSEDRNAEFKFDMQTMGGYNLNKLRVVEVELLDPVQVRTITEDVDSVIYCATDFEGNRPRAVASFNAAFLFRAVAAPTKGRVEVEGLRNCLEGLAGNIKDAQWKDQLAGTIKPPSKKASDPTQFVLVSTGPDAFGEFETPFGEFNGIKRQGEYILANEFPSISHSILQMGKFDDNFVEEGQEVQYAAAEKDTAVVDGVIMNARSRAADAAGVGFKGDDTQKRINRRDAARAAVEALVDEDLEGKKVQVHTAVRKTDIW